MTLRISPSLLPNFCLLSLFAVVTTADSPAKLKPMMATADQIVLQDDFSKSHPLNKDAWQTRQGTRWAIEGGVLRGAAIVTRISSEEERSLWVRATTKYPGHAG